MFGDHGEVLSILESVALSSCHRQGLPWECLRQRETKGSVPRNLEDGHNLNSSPKWPEKYTLNFSYFLTFDSSFGSQAFSGTPRKLIAAQRGLLAELPSAKGIF